MLSGMRQPRTPNRKTEPKFGFLPMTGEELVFVLNDLDAFEVIGL